MAANAAQGRICSETVPSQSVSLSLAPLGVPLEIDLAGKEHAVALAAACMRWRGVADPSVSRLGLRLAVGRHLAAPGQHPVAITVADFRLSLRGPGVVGFADGRSGQAECSVSPGYFDSPERLRAEVLEPLILYLLSLNGRAPIHAAGFLAGGRAILLAGPSGSGKSCLARAADQAGFQVLSEDMVHVQRFARLRVWGWPGPAHLLPADAPADCGCPTRVRNGKTKYALPLHSSTLHALSAEFGALCLLRRGEALALERLAPDAALRRVEQLEPGFDCVADAVGEAYAALMENGAWQLTLSPDPAEAIRFVGANLARLIGNSAP